MLFARVDWLARKYYSHPSNRRQTKWLPVSNNVALKKVKLLFGPLVIRLVVYIKTIIHLHFGEYLLINISRVFSILRNCCLQVSLNFKVILFVVKISQYKSRTLFCAGDKQASKDDKHVLPIILV